MMVYDELAAHLEGFAASDASIVAIVDADGHMAVYPVSPQLLDDEPMDKVTAEVFDDLLHARRVSRAAHADR